MKIRALQIYLHYQFVARVGVFWFMMIGCWFPGMGNQLFAKWIMNISSISLGHSVHNGVQFFISKSCFLYRGVVIVMFCWRVNGNALLWCFLYPLGLPHVWLYILGKSPRFSLFSLFLISSVFFPLLKLLSTFQISFFYSSYATSSWFLALSFFIIL